MSPKLTPYERHIRDLARVRMRAQRRDARRAIAILCGAWLVAGLGIVVETAVLRPVVKSAHVPIGTSVLVLDRRAMGREVVQARE